MADDIQSNIKINIDAKDAMETIRLLQNQISAFHAQVAKMGAASAADARNLQQNLVNSINATGAFSASFTKIKTTAESFTQALEKNKLSMGEYFRYAGASSKSFGRFFKTEFDTIEKVARERVKDLQTQYIKLGRDANGAMQAIKVRPLVLDMNNLATRTQIAAQRQQLLNQLLKQGSTNLLNFGKNTQWAGRQLMVGFTIPLSIMGSAAMKAYKEIEEAGLRLKRVYGDFGTTAMETEKMVKQVQQLALEFTKYGIAVKDSMEMAATAAATGKKGQDLLAQVSSAARLAVLGGVDQQKALQTTISLTDAFSVSSKNLAENINFLNAVENQTVLSIDDMTTAIPKAAPVIKQLGGDVKDLAFFLTAMKEGGVNASEGANAIKSGLASLINPTNKASEMLAGFGINVKKIVESNKGDVASIVVDFAKALDTLDPLNRAQAIEQLFGKFQFARMSTLFKNVIEQGSQASEVLRLASQSSLELSMLAQRELNKIQQSPLYKFQKAVADFQAQLAPVGEQFMKAITPLINFGTDVLKGFNNLEDGVKQFIVKIVSGVGVIGPVLIMSFGLVANAIANIIKGFALVKDVFNRAGKSSLSLGEQVNYMTQEQLQAAAVASSLDQVHSKLKQTFTSEAAAVDMLTAAYKRSIAAQNAMNVPITPRGPVRKYASGGIISGPGTGTSDSILAMVSNGEAIIPAASVARNPNMVRQLISGNIPGFSEGGITQREFVFPDNVKITEKNAKRIRERIQAARVVGDDFANSLIERLEGLTKFTSATIDSVLERPEYIMLRNMYASKANADNPRGRNTGSTGIVKAHGTLSRDVLLEDIDSLLNPTLREMVRQSTKTSVLSNLVFGMPGAFNDKLMTGAEGAGFVKQFYPQFMSILADQGLDINDPAAKAFGNNVARQLELAGSQTISDSQFAEIISKAMNEEIYAIGKNVSANVRKVFDDAQKISSIQVNVPGKPTERKPIPTEGRNQISPVGVSIPLGVKSYLDTKLSEKDNLISDEYIAQKSKERLAAATAAGTADATAYVTAQKKVAAVPENDLAIVTRNATKRNSPHEQASVDGRDDANAYDKARETQAKRNQSRKSRRVQTQGDSFTPGQQIVVVPTQIPSSGGMENAVTDPSGLMTERKLKLRERYGTFGIARSLQNFGKMDRQDLAGRITSRSFGLGTALSMGSMFIPGAAGQIMGGLGMASMLAPMFSGKIAGGIQKAVQGKDIEQLGLLVKGFGRLIPYVGAAVIAFELFDKVIVPMAKQNADAYAAITETLSVTQSKLDKVNSFFGTDIKVSGIRASVIASGAQSAKQASIAKQFQESQEFKDVYQEQAKKLKDLSNAEFKRTMEFMAIDLISQGMEKEQVKAIIDAIALEAEKSSVSIAPQLFNLDSPESKALMAKNINDVLDTVGQLYEKNKNVGVMSPEDSARIKAGQAQISSYMSALSSQFANGAITGKEFNIQYEKLIKLTNSKMGATAGIASLKSAFILLNEEIGKTIAKLNDVQFGIVSKALLAGVTSTEESMAVFNSGNQELIDQQVIKYGEAYQKQLKLNEQVKQQESKLKSIQNSNNNIAKTEEKINEKYDKRIAQIEKIKKLNDQIAKSQEGQLNLAEALNRGDVGAAARAAMELQQTDVQNALDRQQTGLNEARQAELKPLKDSQDANTAAIETLTNKIDTLNKSITVENVPLPEKSDLNKFLNSIGVTDNALMALAPFAQFFGINVGAEDKKKNASGGYISGPGTGTSDSIPAMLSNGEYVIRANAVKTIGVDVLDRLNHADRMKFANGGMVDVFNEKKKPPKKPKEYTLKDLAKPISKKDDPEWYDYTYNFFNKEGGLPFDKEYKWGDAYYGFYRGMVPSRKKNVKDIVDFENGKASFTSVAGAIQYYKALILSRRQAPKYIKTILADNSWTGLGDKQGTARGNYMYTRMFGKYNGLDKQEAKVLATAMARLWGPDKVKEGFEILDLSPDLLTNKSMFEDWDIPSKKAWSKYVKNNKKDFVTPFLSPNIPKYEEGGFVSPRISERLRRKSTDPNSMATNDPMAPWNQGDFLKFNDPQTRRQYWAMSQKGSKEIVDVGKNIGYFTPVFGSGLSFGDAATAFGKGDVAGGILNTAFGAGALWIPRALGLIGKGFNAAKSSIMAPMKKIKSVRSDLSAIARLAEYKSKIKDPLIKNAFKNSTLNVTQGLDTLENLIGKINVGKDYFVKGQASPFNSDDIDWENLNLNIWDSEPLIDVSGKIYLKKKPNQSIGSFSGSILNTGDYGITTEGIYVELAKEYQRKGIGKKLTSQLMELFKTGGLDATLIKATLTDGGYAWAKAGFEFAERPDDLLWRMKRMQEIFGSDKLQNLIDRISSKYSDVSPNQILKELNFDWRPLAQKYNNFDFKTTEDIISALGPAGIPKVNLDSKTLGELVLRHSSWSGYKPVSPNAVKEFNERFGPKPKMEQLKERGTGILGNLLRAPLKVKSDFNALMSNFAGLRKKPIDLGPQYSKSAIYHQLQKGPSWGVAVPNNTKSSFMYSNGEGIDNIWMRGDFIPFYNQRLPLSESMQKLLSPYTSDKTFTLDKFANGGLVRGYDEGGLVENLVGNTQDWFNNLILSMFGSGGNPSGYLNATAGEAIKKGAKNTKQFYNDWVFDPADPVDYGLAALPGVKGVKKLAENTAMLAKSKIVAASVKEFPTVTEMFKNKKAGPDRQLQKSLEGAFGSMNLGKDVKVVLDEVMDRPTFYFGKGSKIKEGRMKEFSGILQAKNPKTRKIDLVGEFRAGLYKNPGEKTRLSGITIVLDEKYRGKGIGKNFTVQAMELFKKSGVDEIKIDAGLSHGGAAWAKAGFRFSERPYDVISRAKYLAEYVKDNDLNAVIKKLSRGFSQDKYIAPIDILKLKKKVSPSVLKKITSADGMKFDTWEDLDAFDGMMADIGILPKGVEPTIGNIIMYGSDWSGIKKLKKANGGMVGKYANGGYVMPIPEPPPAQMFANGGMVKAATGGLLINGKFFSGFAGGGMVPAKFAMGGYAMGTDTVPAMLTPGEFVIKKSAVDRIGAAALQKINGYADGGMVGGSSSNTSVGDSVYNYSINVNVATDSDPNQIARAVMTQIRKIDNHKVRGSAF